MINDEYNIKIVHYKDFDEVQYFRDSIICRDDLLIDEDGVISKKEKKEKKKYFNPFSGEMEEVIDLNEQEFYKYVAFKRSKNMIYKLACNNKPWDYFVTFTFNSDKVDRYNFSEVSKKLSKWIDNIKQKYGCKDMGYIIVPEKHKDGAWHFHGLFKNCDNLNFIDSGLKDKQGRTIYNISNYKFGFTTATKLSDIDKAVSYILKYISKDLFSDNLKGKKRYWSSKNLEMPAVETAIFEGNKIDLLKMLGHDIDYITSSESVWNEGTYIQLKKHIEDTENFDADRFIQIIGGVESEEDN